MAKALRPLAGKVAAVTGGARGIGRATAAALLARGVRVAIGDIDAELAEQTAQALGPGAAGLPLDVTERASFSAFLTEAESRLGPLEIMINNAGIMPVGPFLEETDAIARRMVDINLHGVILGSKLALERFAARGSGHLVNIASIAGKSGVPHLATYVATKHAVVGLTESLRMEFGASGVSFSVVMPVGTNTELYSGLQQVRGIKTPEPEVVKAPEPEQVKSAAPKQTPHGWLVVNAKPWSDVYVDGKKIGEASNGPKRFSVAAGTHLVRLRHTKKSDERTLEIKPGDDTLYEFSAFDSISP